MVEQFRSWLVCQVCSRVAPASNAPHWLNQPHRHYWEVRIVRCPEHWSEWALRHTREGRSNANREAMAKALSQPVPLIPTSSQPFPITERDDPDVTGVRI